MELLDMTDQIAQGTKVSEDGGQRCQQVYEVASALFRNNADWVTFYREVLGLKGIVRRCFSTKDQLAAFEQTQTYAEIQWMLCQLRRRSNDTPSHEESTGVITVRLPKSLHEALRAEAYERRTSMNKLCISKLLQFIDEELVPSNLQEDADQEQQEDSEASL